MGGVNVVRTTKRRPMPNHTKERKLPARKKPSVVALGAKRGLGNDVPPFDTPAFRKRLGEIVAHAMRPAWTRDKRPRPPKRD